MRGTADSYCLKTYRNRWAHKYRDRAQFQQLLGTDKAIHAAFHQDRRQLVTKRQRRYHEENTAQASSSRSPATGLQVRKHHLKKERAFASELARPEDDFYPWARYFRRFGDPRAARNRKLGHKISVVEGVKGVVVPGDDGSQPWKLRRSSQSRLVQEDHESLGSGSEQEQKEVADLKFSDMIQDIESNYAQSAVGVINTILEEIAAEAENDPKPKRRTRRQHKDEEEKAAEAKSAAPKPTRWSFVLADSSDDADDPMFKTRQAAAKRIERSRAKAKAKAAAMAAAATTTAGTGAPGGDQAQVTNADDASSLQFLIDDHGPWTPSSLSLPSPPLLLLR